MPSLLYTMATVVRATHPFVCQISDFIQGDTIAKFASKNVHKRLVTAEAYSEKRYEEALKRAFLGTDEDLLAGEFLPLRCWSCH
jgi:hypothetical protein